MSNLLKRIFDLSISLILFILLIPILIIIAIIIKIDSKGSVLFKQERLKKNGVTFNIIKFRSMVKNAELMDLGLYNYKNDKRVTKFGSFIRKTSLDELPQLINIIIGDMSLVGPRPPVSYELGDYKLLSNKYKKRFSVKPGVTGLAQISGRNENDWDEKVMYDNLYVDKFNNYGIFFDIKIIILTVFKVFKRSEIFEIKSDEIKDKTDKEITIYNNKKIINNAQREEN